VATRPRIDLSVAGAAVAAATVGVGLGVEAAGHTLGTATPPFVMAFGVRLHALAVASVAAVALAAWLAPRLPALLSAPIAYAVALFALAAGLGVALNLARYGAGGLDRVFDPGRSFEAKNEYLPALGALSYGPRFFLDRFAELVSGLPVNVAGHPPGFPLLFDALGIRTPAGLAALCIGAGSLTAPLTYGLGREVLGAARGRVAGLLGALSPGLLLLGVSSADCVYAALGVLAAWLLLARPALGAVALAWAAFFDWALLAIGAWAVIVIWRRDGIRRAVLVAASCVVALVAFNGALAAAYGYDPIGTLSATHAVYGHSLARIRPYWFWLFGSPVAWGVMLGLPIAAYALRSLAERQPAAVALAAIVIVASVLGFTKAETERIWLAFVPLACVAAAGVLPPRRLGLVCGVLLAQGLVVQVLFDTVW